MFFSSSRNRSHSHTHKHHTHSHNHHSSSKVHTSTKAAPSSASHTAYTTTSSSFRNDYPSTRIKQSSFIHQIQTDNHPPSSSTHTNTHTNTSSSFRPNQTNLSTSPALTSRIITLALGPTARLFAAHEQVLLRSPYFANLLQQQKSPPATDIGGARATRIDLPHIEAEVFSCILEYLYKGDYSPRLMWDGQGVWTLENDSRDGAGEKGEGVVWISSFGGEDSRGGREGGWVVKDTAIYCTALLLTLPELARLALKKHTLPRRFRNQTQNQAPLQCSTILSSARYVYANTPDTESRLRAHYLALIIRSRDVFKRSGSMQAEMERGGGGRDGGRGGGLLWFDLFVALVGHLDDVAASRGL